MSDTKRPKCGMCSLEVPFHHPQCPSITKQPPREVIEDTMAVYEAGLCSSQKALHDIERKTREATPDNGPATHGETPTPRTDALFLRPGVGIIHKTEAYDLCRALERELAQVTKERDDARKDSERLRSAVYSEVSLADAYKAKCELLQLGLNEAHAIIAALREDVSELRGEGESSLATRSELVANVQCQRQATEGLIQQVRTLTEERNAAYTAADMMESERDHAKADLTTAQTACKALQEKLECFIKDDDEIPISAARKEKP